MNIEQQVQDALDDLDLMLLRDLSVEAAVAQAAQANGLKPEVVLARAERSHGDLEDHRGKLKLRAASAARESERQEHERQVRAEAAAAAEATFYDCDLHDPVRAGRPSWPFVIARHFERLQITDYRLQQVVRKAFHATLKRLDRKHGTSEVRMLGIERPAYRPPSQ